MAFSEAEKLLLSNQYQILSILDPINKKDYELLLTCLDRGYDADFEQLAPDFEPTLSPDVRQEVRDILEMFRAIYPNQHSMPGTLPEAAFAGFDGNEEPEHYAYARFLLEERGLWSESKTNNYNTHTNVLGDYRKMLLEWNKSSDKLNLTKDDIKRVVAFAPFRSRRTVE